MNDLLRLWIYLQDNNNSIELDFTGQHRCLLTNDFTSDDIGKIVACTGDYYNFDKTTKPKISEAMPVVKLSDTSKDKKCLKTNCKANWLKKHLPN